MSACVESMFSVRELPWHGLGTIVADAPTSADALHLAGLDWDVVPSPVYLENGILVPGYKANKRSSDGKVLGIVSDRYKIVQNADAFSFTDALIGDEVKYETAGSLLGGKRIWLLAKMPTEKILGDDVDPYICFTNTHDGTGAIKVCMTNTRVVCCNTLNIALDNAKRMWSTKHMGNIEEKLEEARETLELARNYNRELAIEADRLANTTIKDEELYKILEEMFPINTEDSNRKTVNMTEARDTFIKCYHQEDIQKFLGTWWGVINAASDMAGHSVPARVTETYKENNWNRIIDGHKILDSFYDRAKIAIAA